MILDHIDNYHLYKGLNKNLDQALEYVKGTDFLNLPDGKYEINAEQVFAILATYFTKSKEEALLEAHVKYVDIQFMITGEEYIQVAPLKNQKVTTAYPENDLTFYEGEGQLVKLSAGNFMVFFTTDAHGPGIQIEQSKEVKKVVVKVALDTLNHLK